MTAEREALDKALKQMECLQENLHKGMSKSIQRMQGFALMETVAEIRAAMRAADQQSEAAHRCDAWALTCRVCGREHPATPLLGWSGSAGQRSEPLGRCCYGGMKKKSDCASCAAWAADPKSGGAA
jgi:hypothetical protein